jgi:hypothetical protein
MPDQYQYTLALSALRKIHAEIGQDLLPEMPLADAIAAFESLPSDSLLFGFASDGLPLMLHLRNSQPGPILIVGDQGCGKTDFLKKLVFSTQRLMPPGETQFTVLTNFPEEWAEVSAPEHLLGIWPAYEPVSTDLLLQLAYRVQTPLGNQPTVLLFDGLESIIQLENEAQSCLAQLLMHGPHTLIWPVVTVNAELALDLPYWLSFFRTRIFGRVANARTAQKLTSMPGAPLSNLPNNSQFCLRENSHWLKFWLPSL